MSWGRQKLEKSHSLPAPMKESNLEMDHWNTNYEDLKQRQMEKCVTFLHQNDDYSITMALQRKEGKKFVTRYEDVVKFEEEQKSSFWNSCGCLSFNCIHFIIWDLRKVWRSNFYDNHQTGII
eukprot:TRINITY_DN4827_c1_g1_i1.p3 TRINITY_DN4827_c1_g1~~TRINITY_DN4827_c1_g1_i1.p3  ORF type:complete len:122 (+),score=9.62 TRINITY_DN4827_c1_g1_i1:107-472(+)